MGTVENISPHPPFAKALAKYYHKWFRDSLDSVKLCKENGDHQRAAMYQEAAEIYFDIIINNWDAVEFFSVGKNAFTTDMFLPKEWRGYR